MDKSLHQVRVIGLLMNAELFGQEKANIQVFQVLKQLGATVCVGINRKAVGSQVDQLLGSLGIESFPVSFGFQWSKKFFKKQPTLLYNNLRYATRSSIELHHKIREFRPTHIQIGNPLAYSMVAACLAIHRTKLIYRMGDIAPVDSAPNLWIWRRFVARSHKVVVISGYVKKTLESAHARAKHKSQLILNIAPFQPSSGTHVSVGLQNCPPRFVFIGQIGEHKGIVDLIEVAIRVVRKTPTVRFDIVGGSQYTVELEQKLRERVASENLESNIVFHGYQKSCVKFLENATALIVPSLCEEAAGNVVLEAKSVGVPSLVYPSGGLPEMITDGKSGWVCESSTQGALELKIDQLVNGCFDISAFRESCLVESNQKFGFERFVSEWFEVYSA